MDFRRIVKRKPFPKESAEFINVSTLDQSNQSYIEVDQSLLIHEGAYEVSSEDVYNDQEIYDTDIPLDKRDLINNSHYFKQLSLSFYGVTQPIKKPSLKQKDEQYNFVTEPSRLNTSLSPKSQQSLFYGWSKSPTSSQKEKDHFHLTFNNFSQLNKKDKFNLTGYKVNSGLIRGKTVEKSLLKDNKTITNIDAKESKLYRINTPKLNTSITRTSPNPHLATILTIGSAATTRQSNFFDKETSNSPTIKRVVRPSLKKLSSSKVISPSHKEYLITEPSTASSAGLKTSASSQLIPKKLKMYAQDNSLNLLNIKGIGQGEERSQTTRPMIIKKKVVPAKPSLLKGIEGIVVKRNVVPLEKKIYQKTGYYI